MKKIHFLVLLFFAVATRTLAQSGQVFQLNKLSARDTLLSGWKIQPGDDMRWAQSEFDDSKWQAGDPGQDITEFKPIHQTGICWLRLHISADSAVAQQQLTAYVFQYTASEIYLDGKLIKSYGAIGKRTTAYCPIGDFFALPLKSGSDHIIAVRIAYQSGLVYTSPFFIPLSAFSMYVNDIHSISTNYEDSRDLSTESFAVCAFFSGMCAIIGVIYLFFFLYDRKQKVFYYYVLFSGFLFLLTLCFTFFTSGIQSVTTQMWLGFILAVSFIITSLFLVLNIYTLFNYNSRAVFKGLILAGIAALIYQLASDIIGFVLASNVFMTVCYLEGTRVSILAVKTKKKGATFILIGIITSAICIIWSGLLPQTTLFSVVLGLLAVFGFPLSMAVYLAIQNAITNQNLLATANEVQLLSQQKQQILASQNEVLEQQVTERTAELNQSLNNLKATQTQLIQKEKMASLGELTAGIAHEIQNPLNFVNNFSEVSVELLAELKDEAEAGNKEDVIAIANDLTQNLEKINHHGKRADSIVKGMLEHSKIGTGEKVATDINILVDEFLKLSYHGLRAKDKSFNVALITRFDEKLPKINVSQQDIGRVMLNLFNNAFYAVNQKQKTEGVDYKPEVTVSTSIQKNNLVIKVKDNGSGIPDTIKEKIMQPFFTTKPTGEGTGLGLSLSYDIVVKGHSGTITVNTKENEFTEFSVSLPIDK